MFFNIHQLGDWGLGIGPNPQSPNPNPQSPNPINKFDKILFTQFKYCNNNLNILYNKIILMLNVLDYLNNQQ